MPTSERVHDARHAELVDGAVAVHDAHANEDVALVAQLLEARRLHHAERVESLHDIHLRPRAA